MGKTVYFWIILCCFAVFYPLKAQEFQGIRATPDPLDEKIQLDPSYIPNYRELMRDTVVTFSEYVKNTRPDFYIVAYGGKDLLTRGQWENDLDELHRAEMAGAKTEDERFLLKLFSPEEPLKPGTPNRRYLQALKAYITVNSVCGKKPLDSATTDLLKKSGISLLAIEHCPTAEKRTKAQTVSAKKEIPVHADTDLKARYDQLDTETPPFLENQQNITSLNDVRNILFMTDTHKYSSRDAWVDALSKTNYDLVVIDPFYKFNEPLSVKDVQQLKLKKMGAKRLVFAVLNIAVAEDTRMYWEKSWKLKSPPWLRFPSKTNPAGIVVDYWNPEWKRIIGIYFKSIMDLGFDGVVLQGLDEHFTYEKIIPIN